MKKIVNTSFKVIGAMVLVVALAGIYRFNFTNGGDIIPGVNVSDPRNMTYTVGKDVFTLKDGVAEIKSVPSSSASNILRIFGEPVYGDLDKDGDNDAAVLLVNNPGGSGTFYYAVLVINNGATQRPTNVMFLGDRIAPQTVNILEGRAVYNFAERRADEPMSVQPSIGKSVWVHYDAVRNEIGEWVKDFEGESAVQKK